MANGQRLTVFLLLLACALAAPVPDPQAEDTSVVPVATKSEPTLTPDDSPDEKPATSTAAPPQAASEDSHPTETTERVAPEKEPSTTEVAPTTTEAVPEPPVDPVDRKDENPSPPDEGLKEYIPDSDIPPFPAFDINKDGFIDPDEFSQVGRFPPESFVAADTDEDGLLSEEEFTKYFGSPPQDDLVTRFEGNEADECREEGCPKGDPLTSVEPEEPSAIVELPESEGNGDQVEEQIPVGQGEIIIPVPIKRDGPPQDDFDPKDIEKDDDPIEDPVIIVVTQNSDDEDEEQGKKPVVVIVDPGFAEPVDDPPISPDVPLREQPENEDDPEVPEELPPTNDAEE